MTTMGGASRRHTDRSRYAAVIEQYLADCYARRTVARVSELADLLKASRPYLSRVIPQLFGRSLRRLLRERQLEEAKRLLRLTDLHLDEIAAASAFGDRSTFYRLFRTMAGITPHQYRLTRRRARSAGYQLRLDPHQPGG